MLRSLLVILTLHHVIARGLLNLTRTQLRNSVLSSDGGYIYGSSDISWTDHLIDINVVSSTTNFQVVFSLSIKPNTNRDFVIRWSRVGCDRLVEGIFKECNLPDGPAEYMAVMENQHTRVCSVDSSFHMLVLILLRH